MHAPVASVVLLLHLLGNQASLASAPAQILYKIFVEKRTCPFLSCEGFPSDVRL